MQILGFKARYDGLFGNVPVIQAGPYKLISLQKAAEPVPMPLPLAMLIIKARKEGADFLIIDPKARDAETPMFVDVPQGQLLAA